MRSRTFVVVLFALLAAGCASTGGKLGPYIPQVGVETPAINQLGAYHHAPWRMEVKDALPVEGHYIILFAGGQKEPVTKTPLEYGDIGVDPRNYQAHRDDVPLLAKVFTAEGEFLGFAAHHFRLDPGYPRPNTWVIKPEDVLCYDGLLLSDKIRGMEQVATSRQRILRMEIPRPAFSGNTFVQVAVACEDCGELMIRTVPAGLTARLGNGEARRFTESADIFAPSAWVTEKPTIYLAFMKGGEEVRQFNSIRVNVPPVAWNANHALTILATPHGLVVK